MDFTMKVERSLSFSFLFNLFVAVFVVVLPSSRCIDTPTEDVVYMSTCPKKHDVFISFRGEDTRETFTSHLHYALTKENIVSYIDENLIKGDEIGTALAQAIQDSHISLVVFSENYASSKWCFNELLKILECRKLYGQVVIPVFYNTDPSHVRHQTRSYGEAFTIYDRKAMNNESYADTVSQWKVALAEAANIPGWHSSSRTYKDDAQVIQSIVKDVWQKLASIYPNELKSIIHTNGTSEKVESLLKQFSRVGIWGISGIGKTTIARQLFAKHFAHFDSGCFLESISEGSNKFGLTYLRNKLLSELLKQPITATDVHGLHTFIRRRLSGRKVFIVLDDVDNTAQLDYLCAELDELGPNSWLIITTRDRQMFGERVAVIYKVQPWKLEESLRLFSLAAFKQSQPKEPYQLLSQRAVAYAGGVPLALKVLGAKFYSAYSESREIKLEYIERKGKHGIQKMLRISYIITTFLDWEILPCTAFLVKGGNRSFKIPVLKSTGNEVMSTEIGAGDLHVSVLSDDEENASEGKSSENNYHWQGISEETKHSEENPNIQGGEIIAPDTNDLISKELEQQKENEPMDITIPEGEEYGSEEDPFAELERILLGSPESSPKAACSTSDVAIREALHNLECLLKNSLESILSDVQLQQQLQMSLECIKQASHEKISTDVAKLVESMTPTIEDLFKDFSLTKKVVKDHTSRLQQRETLMQRVRDAKKRKESMKKEKSECQDEFERLEEKAKMLDEKIRILVEEKKSVELEKAKMKKSMEKFDSEKKKLDDEAKNMISESKELMSLIKISSSSYDAALLKQQKLKDKWEGFKTAFATNVKVDKGLVAY